MDDQNDTIRLEHGSGGYLSRELVDSLIYPEIKNKDYSELNDAAELALAGNLVFTTDSYVVDPPFFPGGDIGSLAVWGTCNDLSVCGAVPRYLTLSFILEEGFPLSELRRVLASVSKAAEEASVSIVSGDTKVVPKGKGGGIYINTAGVGEKIFPHHLGPSEINPGDRVILSAPVGAHGMAVMAAREGLELGAELCSDHANLFPLCKEGFSFGRELRFIRDATRGGLAAIVNEIVGGADFGIELQEGAIPVSEDVSAVSEILGLNPLEVANEGVLVMVCSERTTELLVDRLKTYERGGSAALIGTVMEDNPGKVFLKTRIGGKRRLDFPRGLLLPRIC